MIRRLFFAGKTAAFLLKYSSVLAILLMTYGMIVLAGTYLSLRYYSAPQTPFLPPAGERMNPEETSFRIALFSDNGLRTDALERIGGRIAESNPVFVCFLGDIARRISTPSFNYIVRELHRHIRGRLYAIPGNHDVSKGYQNYEQFFGQPYYWFGYGDTLFLALDTAEGGLASAEKQWLEQILARERGEFRRCVILMHIPPVGTADDPDYGLPPEEAAALKAILKKYRIDLIFCGHVHRSGSGDFGGIPLAYLPSSGQRIRDPRNDRFGFLTADFRKDGRIDVRSIYVTADDNRNFLEYFFSSEANDSIFYFGKGFLCVLAGLALFLFRGIALRQRN